MKHLFLGLIATIMFSLSGYAENMNYNSSFVKSQAQSYSIDGKSLMNKEIRNSDKKLFAPEKLCVVTVKMTIKVNNKEVVIETTQSFEASTFGCIAAKAAAFIVSVLEPSITI
jgi:hypothetical protein